MTDEGKAIEHADNQAAEDAAWHRHLMAQADREAGRPDRATRRLNQRLSRKGIVRIPAAPTGTVRVPAGDHGRASRTERRRTARRSSSRSSDDDPPGEQPSLQAGGA